MNDAFGIRYHRLGLPITMLETRVLNVTGGASPPIHESAFRRAG